MADRSNHRLNEEIESHIRQWDGTIHGQMVKNMYENGTSYAGEEDEWYEAREIARIIDKVRDDLLAGLDHGIMMDVNGNKVGEWNR